jgi:uncharacterized protein
VLSYPFTDIVSSEEQLREVLGYPQETSIRKTQLTIDWYARQFIEHSPFALVSSASANGRLDVSPRGDGPGFVLVLDEKTLLIPERPGNRRGDTLINVLSNPHVGLLFLIPNVEETLRINGIAAVVRDPVLLEKLTAQNKQPQLAIAVEAQEVFFHCAKAFRRSHLWQPEQWPDRSVVPTLGQIMKEQLRLDQTAESLDCEIEEAYRTRLY